MKQIKHFMLHEHTNSLYKKEASSSISLTKEVADKINELVDAYNTAFSENFAKEQEQDGRISKAVLYMKDNLINSLHDLFKLFRDSGELDSLISSTVYENYASMYNSIGSVVNVKNFGAKGDGICDDTKAITAAISEAKKRGKCTLLFPRGEYCYTDLGNLAIEGIAFIGEPGYKSTVLKCINKIPNHIALKFDAFENSTSETQFCYGVRMENIHVIGNSNTDTCIRIRGCVHSRFSNIYAGECKRAVFDIAGVMTSAFYGVKTINRNYKTITTKPLFGIIIDAAQRGGVDAGASTNDTFINCYFEDCKTGAHLIRSDQVTFTGCAFEYNDEYGIQIEPNARMTLLNACGIENNPVTDYIDNGRLTKMMNSYVQYVANIGGGNCTIENSLIDSIVVSGLSNEIRNVRLKYHAYSDDGPAFTDNGIGTIVENLYSIKESNVIIPMKNRKSFEVTGAPFIYVNNTYHNVEIFCQAGTLADVQFKRPNENWVALNPAVPGRWLVRPGEEIKFGFTETPSLSYIETYER